MEPWTRSIARIIVGDYRGTGFLVSETGLILTAFHVIADREQSRRQRRPVFHDAPIEVRFGDGKDKTLDAGEAEVEPNRYSIEEDWALLRIKLLPGLVAPLQLARLGEPREGRAFVSFGFPLREAETGGEYPGTFGAWGGDVIEAHVTAVDLGTKMGGISGAPCRVDDQIVAMILQSLADERNGAVKASLYVRPIERAVRGCEGLLAWDDGAPMTFQGEVEGNLPDDDAALRRVGGALGLPVARSTRVHVARGLLSSRLNPAAAALRQCQLPAEQAGPIVEHLGAMQLHDDAIEQLRDAAVRHRPALVSSVRHRVHKWYLRRCQAPEPISERKIAVVRAAPGHEESARSAVDALLERIQRRLLDNKLGPTLVRGMLSVEVKDARRFWVVLIGEFRCDVIAELAARLPNATVVGGFTGSLTIPEQARAQVEVVAPTMTADEELELIEQWESAAGDLNVPIEPEEDT